MAVEKLPVGEVKMTKVGQTSTLPITFPKSEDVKPLAYIQIHGLTLAILGVIYISILNGGSNPNMTHQILGIMTIVIGTCRFIGGFYFLKLLVKAEQRRPDVEQNGKAQTQDDKCYWLRSLLFSISSVWIIVIFVGLLLSEAYGVSAAGAMIAIWIIISCGLEVGFVLLIVLLGIYFLLLAC